MYAKKLYPVTKKFDIKVSNSPHVAQEFYVDFAGDATQTLSDYFGKNVRQGHSFKLCQIDLGIQPKQSDGSDYDVGLAVSCQHVFTPATKHTRQAWNQMFKEWAKQKTLAGVVGSTVRYDDFELAYDDVHAATTFLNRRSSIYATGLADSNTEALSIQGLSVAGSDLSLKDYYEDRNPISLPSSTPFGGVVKQPKFASYWPDNVELQTQATLSSIVTDTDQTPPLSNYLSGAVSMSTGWEGNVDVFCGSIRNYVYVTADDTIGQIADEAELTVTFWIASWKPLVYSAKKNRTRSTSRRFKSAYRNRRSNRRYKRSRR